MSVTKTDMSVDTWPHGMSSKLSEPILTQFLPTPTQYVPPSFLFPLVLVPTLYASLLSPTLDYAPLVGTLVASQMYPFVFVSLHIMFPSLGAGSSDPSWNTVSTL